MNDRTVDNQFSPGNPLTQEQLRLVVAALTGQGLLGSNMNRQTATGLQNILNPIIPALAATTSTPPNLNDPTPGQLDHHHHQQQQQQHQQQQQQLIQHEITARLHQQLQQIVQQSQRPQQPHPSQASDTASLSIRQQQSLQNSLQASTLPGLDQQKRKRGRPPLSAPGTSAGSGSSSSAAIDYSYVTNLFTTLKNQQMQREPKMPHRERDVRIQQERERARLLAQERNAELRLQSQQQPHPSQASSLGVGDAALLNIRQQQTLQNSLQSGSIPGVDQQKRKRGRPPASSVAPSTSAGSSSASAIEYNYMNMIAAVKNQQDRERLKLETKLQQDRQRQQEIERLREVELNRERQLRLREQRLRQEQERQRAEYERQRKAQLRQALQDIDRERRRQHMIMVRNLDAYKRNEEREKTMNAMMAERNKLMERRMYQKRLEVELIKDIRKPIDDMMLKNQKPLATLNRIPGLKLPGKAFADLLMSYEFCFNFVEGLGLSGLLPSIDELQSGLLNLDTQGENELILILHHLCMFAIKDPRFPYTGSLKEIENLDRTNEGLSQLLHFYLQVLTLNAKTDMEHEYRLYKLIEQKYFLSLNATQKAEMLAFICNELLCSQTLTKQMEDTIENVAKLRKDKWVLENEIRKYRVIKTKRELKEEAELKAKEAASAAVNINGESDKISEDDKITDSKDQIKTDPKRDEEEEDKANKSSLTNGSSLIENTPNKRENETDTSLQPNNTADLDDLEPGMTNDELNKKIDNLTRQYNKTSNKLDRAINSMRACPLGQDRYRRRYWVLPHLGGVFVEGMESSEPEELENNKFTDEELIEYEKEQKILNELASNTESTEKIGLSPIKEDNEDVEMEIKDEVGDVKEEDDAMDIKDEDAVDAHEIKEEVKIETIENCVPDGDKEANETSEVNEATETNEVAEPTCEETNSLQVSSSPWFSILPRISCDFSKTSSENAVITEGEDSQKKESKEDGAESKAELSSEELRDMRHEICPALAKRLEDLEAEQYESPKKIHPQFQFGWWRITDSQQLKAILSVLHERGARERILHKHLTKHFQYACNSCKIAMVDFQITSYDRQLAGKNYGAPLPHDDEDSADDLKDGEEEEEEEDFDEETDSVQQAAIVPSKKSKRKKASRSARSRRLRARAAARKKVENSKNKLAVR